MSYSTNQIELDLLISERLKSSNLKFSAETSVYKVNDKNDQLEEMCEIFKSMFLNRDRIVLGEFIIKNHKILVNSSFMKREQPIQTHHYMTVLALIGGLNRAADIYTKNSHKTYFSLTSMDAHQISKIFSSEELYAIKNELKVMSENFSEEIEKAYLWTEKIGKGLKNQQSITMPEPFLIKEMLGKKLGILNPVETLLVYVEKMLNYGSLVFYLN